MIDTYRFLKGRFNPFLSKISIQNKLLIFLALILLSLFSFTTFTKDIISDLPFINLTKLPLKEKSLYMSDFASKVTYIQLESKQNCLIGPGVSFNLFDSILVSSAHHQILTFNSINGKFLKSIGEYSNGPNGYMNSKSSYIKNGEIIITALGWDFSLMEFSTNGEILCKLKIDKKASSVTWLSDNLYAIYYDKVSNYDSLRLQIYDFNKEMVVSNFYDNRKFKAGPKRTTNFGAFFYYNKNKLFIKEFFNDTVFQVTTNKLIPTIEFESGKYSPPFFEKHKFDYTQFYNIQTILETKHRIFFQLYFKKRAYFCLFDKRTNQLMIPNYKGYQFNGFENDIDGFMQFHPTSISNRNELVGFLEPFEIRLWFDKNPEKSKMLPPHLQKLRNIQESDNPVLMLVKLKE